MNIEVASLKFFYGFIFASRNLNRTQLGAVYIEGGRSQTGDHPCAIRFLFSVYMQWVVLVPSARIFLVLKSPWLRDRKILAPCKLPSLGTSQYQGQSKQKWQRVVQKLITVKGRLFRLVLQRPDFWDNWAKRQLLTSVRRADVPNFIFVFVARPSNSFSILLHLSTTRTEIFCMKTHRNDVLPSRIFLLPT